MLSDFENKIAGFIKANKLFDNTSKAVLAVSGGADSIALLHVMQALKRHNYLEIDMHCVHVNHLLRARQADSDEDFVVEQAGRLKLAVTTRRINVRDFARRNKLSIETAARKLRLKSLLDIAMENNCNCIVMGHQKNDNAETVLHRILRGTGYRGLAGIWPVRKFDDKVWFIRPLLCVTRSEIIDYLQKNKLKWCEDRTNTDCRYTRNYIRHQLLPAVQKDDTGSLIEQLFRLSESARKFYNIICQYSDDIRPNVAKCTGGNIILNLKDFSKQSKPVKVELVRQSLAELGCGERDLTRQHYIRILRLASQKITGRTIELPGGFVVRREYGDLIFSRYGRVGFAPPVSNRPLNADDTRSIILKIPGKTKFDKYLIEARITEANGKGFERFKAAETGFIEQFDLNRIELPLSVRFRQVGDRFVPLGQKGEKKLGKFLTDQRIPYNIRRNMLVVTDREKIIWLWPVRMSEQAKLAGNSRKILQLRITNVM
jgi:tRNA(Ile)-lysidine synthase